MSKVKRSCIVAGEWYRIECAIREDGSSPAREFLDLISGGMWQEDPEVEEVPDDEQVKDYDRLVGIMRYFAREGCPEHKGQINYLVDGLWEFKCHTKRLVFYDTDGRGGYVAKGRIEDRAQSAYPDEDTWFLPEMDYNLRLANAWVKTGQTADYMDIQEALRIREEDLAHDRDDGS